MKRSTSIRGYEGRQIRLVDFSLITEKVQTKFDWLIFIEQSNWQGGDTHITYIKEKLCTNTTASTFDQNI